MSDIDVLAERFEGERSRLRSVAYRLLGATAEADDAVQETWLRLNRADVSGVDNLGGWLTTVLSRVCLDTLRTRASRPEDLGDVEIAVGVTPDDRAGPEAQAVTADALSGAVLVVLDSLTPPERVAFVLHDMFGVGFDEIARTVDRTPAATRKLASRARRRVRGSTPADQASIERQRRVIEAFLHAARHGDLDGIVAVLAPDVVLRSDHAAAAMAGGLARLDGSDAVAAEFSGRAQAAQVALVDGSVGVVVAPGGQLIVILKVVVDDGRITDIQAVADPDHLRSVRYEVFRTLDIDVT